MPEQQNIEWKLSWRDEYLKWICGFANGQGGKMYIGLNDHGKVSGINNYNELLEQLPNKFRDILGVYAEVNLESEHDKKYIEIVVPRYDVPISVRGKYYVRSGSTLQELNGLALNEFILKRTGKTWDDIAEIRASTDDIDKSTVRQFIKDAGYAKRINIETNISMVSLLEKLRLLENGQLKRAAIVLFGKDPGKFYPNMSVKIGRFDKSDADLKFHEVIEGNLIQLKEKISEMLNAKFFIHPIDFVGMQRIERDEYPVAAVREMILNALVHRNYMGATTQIRLYNNQFNVWNDGGLPDGITEQDLWKVHRSKPRNPLIADVCFKAGYIDSWGRGTIKIIEACMEAGMPKPNLEEEQGGFVCKIFKPHLIQHPETGTESIGSVFLRENYGRNTEELRKKYGRNAMKIIGWMIEKPEITTTEIAEKITKSRSTVEKVIKVLRETKTIERVGSTKAGYWKVNI